MSDSDAHRAAAAATMASVERSIKLPRPPLGTAAEAAARLLASTSILLLIVAGLLAVDAVGAMSQSSSASSSDALDAVNQLMTLLSMLFNLTAAVVLTRKPNRAHWMICRNLLGCSTAILLGLSFGSWYQLYRGETDNFFEFFMWGGLKSLWFWPAVFLLLALARGPTAAIFSVSAKEARRLRLLGRMLAVAWGAGFCAIVFYTSSHLRPMP